MKRTQGQIIRVGSIAASLALLVMGGPARSLPAEEVCAGDEMVRRYRDFSVYVSGGTVAPNWLDDGHSFWYAATVDGERSYRRMDPISNVIEPFTPPPRPLAARHWSVGGRRAIDILVVVPGFAPGRLLPG